jgi:hypothetical protein
LLSSSKKILDNQREAIINRTGRSWGPALDHLDDIDWADLWRVDFRNDPTPAYSWENNQGYSEGCYPLNGIACLVKLRKLHLYCGDCGCDFRGAAGAYLYPQGNKSYEPLMVYSSTLCPGNSSDAYHNVCEF